MEIRFSQLVEICSSCLSLWRATLCSWDIGLDPLLGAQDGAGAGVRDGVGADSRAGDAAEAWAAAGIGAGAGAAAGALTALRVSSSAGPWLTLRYKESEGEIRRVGPSGKRPPWGRAVRGEAKGGRGVGMRGEGMAEGLREGTLQAVSVEGFPLSPPPPSRSLLDCPWPCWDSFPSLMPWPTCSSAPPGPELKKEPTSEPSAPAFSALLASVVPHP